MNSEGGKKIGRPKRDVRVPPDKADSLLLWLVSGRSMQSWCEQPGNAALSTVYLWSEEDPAFADRLARARRKQADTLLGQIVDIADAPRDTTDRDDVNRRKMRIEARQKFLACIDPARFGTKVQLGGDGGKPIQLDVRCSAEERERKIAAIIETARRRAATVQPEDLLE